MLKMMIAGAAALVLAGVAAAAPGAGKAPAHKTERCHHARDAKPLHCPPPPAAATVVKSKSNITNNRAASTIVKSKSNITNNRTGRH